jgi:hypothetical protein
VASSDSRDSGQCIVDAPSMTGAAVVEKEVSAHNAARYSLTSRAKRSGKIGGNNC